MKTHSSIPASWLRGFNRLVLFTSVLLFASQSFAQPYATVSTLAGGPFNDGPAAAARFSGPCDVAVAADGTVYVADRDNRRIRKFLADGSVITFAGSGTQGFADGPGEFARFNNPTGITIGMNGDLYVADALNHRIRKITPAGVVSTLAGSGVAGFADGPGATAQFNSPLRLTTGPDGSVYVADVNNHRIRKITTDGMVSTLAGSGAVGFADGPSTSAKFSYPSDVAVDSTGVVYVADSGNCRVRKINLDNVVQSLAGTGTYGNVDGPGATAQFYNLNAITIDAEDTLYVADGAIRHITRDGLVSTLAGSSSTPGFVDGVGSTARFSYPSGVAIDLLGRVYVADTDNHRIRRISTDGVVSSLNGSPQWWSASYFGIYGFSNGQGTESLFNNPTGLAVDAVGTVYVADTSNHVVRKITADGTTSTLAGTGVSGYADGPWGSARFSSPSNVAVDANGTVYVADSGNQRIRKITPSGVVSTLAGSGLQGSIDGPGAVASFSYPSGLAVDLNGNVYVAADGIRKITPDGTVSTLLSSVGSNVVAIDSQGVLYYNTGWGGGICKLTPGGAVSTLSVYGYVQGLAVDATGNVYVTDDFNQAIRKITPGGVVSTLITSSYYYFDGPTNLAGIYSVSGIATGSTGLIYFSSPRFNAIRVIRPPTAFDYWMTAQLPAADRENPAKTSASADPDNDGRANLLEYALGSSPLAATTTAPGELIFQSGGTWLFRYVRPAGLAGVSYVVESSPDLFTWIPCAVTVSSAANNTETVEGTLPSTQPGLFARLRVTATQ